MTERRSIEGLEWARATVASGGTAVLTDDVVEMAFAAPFVTPGDTDWLTAEWESGGPPYIARVLVGEGAGPLGGTALPVGTYYAWVRVTDQPEIPARPAFQLEVY